MIAAPELSNYLSRLLAAEPQREAQLEIDCRSALTSATLGTWWEQQVVGVALDSATVSTALRSLRKRVMATIITRDVLGKAPLEEVTQAISALAELAIVQAVQVSEAQLIAMHGVPSGRATLQSNEPVAGTRTGFVTLGMGKLGGGELNVSSDIDLIFAYPTPSTWDEETTGPRKLATEEFYARLSRQVIDIISKVTGDGFVFRVDMRLRPFGTSGPIASSLASLEQYFTAHGRAWERYAWAKARLLTGDDATRNALTGLIQPFVYRRYADYALIEALRDLAERIRKDHGEVPDDVKLGRGGIREAEFSLQALQLIHGGRIPALITQSTLRLAKQLEERGLISTNDVDALIEGYRFLRRLEHMIQYLDDQQTQTLPSDMTARERLAAGMSYASWPALEAQMNLHRLEIATQFNTLLRPIDADVSNGLPAALSLSALLIGAPEPAAETDIAQTLTGVGLESQTANDIANQVRSLVTSGRFVRLSQENNQRMAALFDRALLILRDSPLSAAQRADALSRLFDLVEAVLTRTAYIALLAESPDGLPLLIERLSRSIRVAQMLKRFPLLIEAAMGENEPPEHAQWLQDLRSAQLDDEHFLNRLREQRLHTQLYCAIAACEGIPDLFNKTSLALSTNADAIVQAAFDRLASQSEFVEVAKGFVVVGYGKLGSCELGANSDLDLVFLYDGDASPFTSQLIRFATRLMSALTVATTSGKLFEVDIRLRPDGEKGLMVTALSAFEHYLAERAWLWELQALTRARAIAGSPNAMAHFEDIRRVALCKPRDTADVLKQVSDMRVRMRNEHVGRKYDGQLKYVSGGFIDFEFCVQALLLMHAAAQSSLVEHREPVSGLQALAESAPSARWVSTAVSIPNAMAVLRNAATSHELSTPYEQSDGALRIAESAFAVEREAIGNFWSAVFGGNPT